MKQKYTPQPLDTSDVELSEELQQLVEQLAKNVHDIWAIGRLNDGWTYGPERNDTLKHHPCLVDYSDLPESEKEYDRNTAMETLKMILKLGWKVRKNRKLTLKFYNKGNDNPSSLKDNLKKEWQKKHSTGCYLLIMSVSVVSYVVLIGVSLFNMTIAASGDLLIDLITRLSFLVALSLMMGFWLRFLGRSYSEIQHDNLRMSTKILDAYNTLLEDEVKNEKSHNKKDDKANAEVDCNKTKLQQESSKEK